MLIKPNKAIAKKDDEKSTIYLMFASVSFFESDPAALSEEACRERKNIFEVPKWPRRDVAAFTIR